MYLRTIHLGHHKAFVHLCFFIMMFPALLVYTIMNTEMVPMGHYTEFREAPGQEARTIPKWAQAKSILVALVRSCQSLISWSLWCERQDQEDLQWNMRSPFYGLKNTFRFYSSFHFSDGETHVTQEENLQFKNNRYPLTYLDWGLTGHVVKLFRNVVGNGRQSLDSWDCWDRRDCEMLLTPYTLKYSFTMHFIVFTFKYSHLA